VLLKNLENSSKKKVMYKCDELWDILWRKKFVIKNQLRSRIWMTIQYILINFTSKFISTTLHFTNEFSIRPEKKRSNFTTQPFLLHIRLSMYIIWFIQVKLFHDRGNCVSFKTTVTAAPIATVDLTTIAKAHAKFQFQFSIWFFLFF
jgi:hypothetical protein